MNSRQRRKSNRFFERIRKKILEKFHKLVQVNSEKMLEPTPLSQFLKENGR